jgi:hypothetical protein
LRIRLLFATGVAVLLKCSHTMYAPLLRGSRLGDNQNIGAP